MSPDTHLSSQGICDIVCSRYAAPVVSVNPPLLLLTIHLSFLFFLLVLGCIDRVERCSTSEVWKSLGFGVFELPQRSSQRMQHGLGVNLFESRVKSL